MSPAVSNPYDQRGFCRNACSIVLQMQPGNEKYVPIKIIWVAVGFLYGPGFTLADCVRALGLWLVWLWPRWLWRN